MAGYKEQFNTLIRGTKEVIDFETLERRLFYSEKQGVPLTIKLGADPTAHSLHVGHMIPVHKLKQFQDYGHNTVFLLGDFTARIGDPSGLSGKRGALSKEQVEAYMREYTKQVFKVLDENKTKITYNSQWFEDMNIYHFVTQIAEKYTVAQLLARDDFNNRYVNNRPIAMSEFLYPLLQGYDSVALEADVEIGGNDQLFNFIVARQLQIQFNQQPQVVLTLPTIRGLDGKEKMSKSLGNTINISDSPSEMYGKIMSVSDEIMMEYYPVLSLKSQSYLDDITTGKLHPKKAKEDLANELVRLYHSEEKALEAKEGFNRQFVRKEIPLNLEVITLETHKPLAALELLYRTGKIGSKSEIKRLISQKGLRIDGQTVTELMKAYAPENEYILSIGKKRYFKIILKKESQRDAFNK